MGRILFYVQPPIALRTGAPDNDSDDWDVGLIPSLPVPDVTRWIPSIKIDVAAVFQFTRLLPVSGKGDRFLNPTQSQIGYYHEIFNDFVYSHGRLLYTRQILPLYAPELALPTSFANRKAEYRELNTGGFDQAFNTHRFVMCDVSRQLTGGGTLNGQSADVNFLQLRTDRGRRTIAPVEPGLATFEPITIEAGVNYPDRLSGVIWPGWAGTVGFEFSVQADLTVPGFHGEGEFLQNPQILAPVFPPCEGPPPDEPGDGTETHF
jgi:hypothetical protein